MHGFQPFLLSGFQPYPGFDCDSWLATGADLEKTSSGMRMESQASFASRVLIESMPELRNMVPSLFDNVA